MSLRLRNALLSFALVSAPVTAASAQIAVDRSEVFIRSAISAERIGVINVSNSSDRAVQAVVKIEDWDRSSEGANRWFPIGTVSGSCGKALSVFPLSIRLEPGASQSVRLTLADSGASLRRECWNAVMFETAQDSRANGGMNYIVRTAVKVYVEPEGLRRDGEVTDVAVRSAVAGNDSVEVWFKNTGQLHFVATGAVEFRRADNSLAARVDLPEYYLLPGARQRTIVQVPKLPPGEYIALAIVDHGGAELSAMQLEYRVAPSAATRP